MDKIKEILTSKQAKTIYWQLFNGVLLLGGMYITEINWVYAPLVLPFIYQISKFINQTYLTESDTTM